jgi:hypothetical protein
MLAAAAPPVNFVDPTGDSGTAPDITKVSIGLTDAGRYQFTVAFATPYGANSNLLVYLDTDKNPQTGDTNGADYLLSPAGLQVWDTAAQSWEPSAQESFSVASNGLTVMTSVAPADIGSPKGFDVIVQSLDGAGGAGHMDTAVGQWTGQQAVGKMTVASSHQSAAKAGGTWSVEATAIPAGVSLAGAKGTVKCVATAGTKKLTVVRQVAVLTPGGVSGICIFAVPASAKHKKLAAAVALSIAGESATQKFTATAK